MFPDKTFATADHNTPTINQHLPIKDKLSAMQVKTLEKNCNEHGIDFWGLGHNKNGIVHVIGPENGITQPGLTIVCGDSHTSTHGAFGAIAFGIGTSEVEMVLACQSIMQQKPLKMRINIDGSLNSHVTPKDVAIYIISRLSSSGATGYFVEYSGEVFKNMSMEGRMTVCNLSIEMGARGGMIAPDEKTFEYIKGREYAPKGEVWENALSYWKSLKTDNDAIFDKEFNFNASDIEPMITYGTNPGMAIPISKSIPGSGSDSESSYQKALDYMEFKEGEMMIGKKIDYVFLGSCTNGRIEDFRTFASLIKGRRKSDDVDAWLVPGSHKVLKSIKDEGILDILTDSGFQLREPGCSACLAMNDDKIPKGKYAVSTTNRNFEGRQGPGARTLLASPLVAAATAITGKITDPREII
jgi:3-isopropylmalate/(R)-2-methylmalate dehydratase large subunit